MSTIEEEFRASIQREALFALACWHDVAQWIDYGSLEFTADATTQAHLQHVAQCVREEAERRFAKRAGVMPEPIG